MTVLVQSKCFQPNEKVPDFMEIYYGFSEEKKISARSGMFLACQASTLII